MDSSTPITADEIKKFRQDIDALIQRAAKLDVPSTLDNMKLGAIAEEQVYLMLIEAKMWLGKCLEAMGNPFPANLADKAPSAPQDPVKDGVDTPAQADVPSIS